MPESEFEIAEYKAESRNNYVSGSSSLFDVNSEEVQDIMSKMPHWMISRGTTVLFIIILLIFAGAYFIRYPDIIDSQITITSSNPPVKVVTPASGRIQHLFAQNNQSIKANENICLLENPANYDDLIILKSIVDKLNNSLNLAETVKTISFAQSLQLGELQPGYVDLYQSIHQYLFFIEKDFTTRKVAQLQSQMTYQSALNNELQNRDVLLNQQLIIEKRKFEADSFLLKEKVIAPLEFNNSKNDLITKQMNADATKSVILQNRLQQTEYSKSITDLQQQKLQLESDLQQKIRDDVNRLQGQCKVWEQKYLIKSHVDGKVIFFNVWKENQYVKEGDAIVMIVPPSLNYLARATLPIDGAGRIKIGQKVFIRLSAYPFEEFGLIQGTVSGISSVALDTAYSMDVTLLHELTTTINKKIPSQAQLSGIAEVITEDKNILQRLFEKIWNANRR